MTAAVSVPFPTSRTLAGWWPELRSGQPEALWIRHLSLHRIEAAVRVVSGSALDAFGRAILDSIAHGHALGLDDQFKQRWVSELRRRELVQHNGTTLLVTPSGERVLRGETVLPTTLQRRTFYFAQPAEGPPLFLPLRQPPTTPLPTPPNWQFDPTELAACAQRSHDWKHHNGFPLDVVEWVPPTADGSTEERWQRLVVDHAEQLSLLLVLTRDARGEQVQGFAFQPGQWQLNLHHPVLTLGDSWRERLPELTHEPTPEQWRQAWSVWGQPRSLAVGDLEACSLERSGHLLRVRAPARLVEQLRKTSSDAIKGETWLLSGNGSTRSLALVELLEQTPDSPPA